MSLHTDTGPTDAPADRAPDAPIGRTREGIRAAGSIATLAVAASAGSVANAYTSDDHWIIEWNVRVHHLWGAWRLFAQTYVPPQNGAGNYRPLSMLAFTMEWVLGRGAPWVVHGAGVLLYAIVAVAFWQLATRLLSPRAGWAAAALFAVHPVHADVTANAVGQSELWAALWVILALSFYVRCRERPQGQGREWSGRDIAVLAALYAAACASKEHGFILPLLLGAAELTVVRDRRPWSDRWRLLTRPALALAATGMVYLVVRSMVVGSLAGDYPSFVLAHVPASTRLYTMLGAVPTTLGLMVWPAHLAMEYMPQAIVLHSAPGASLIAPTIVVVGLALIAVLAWRDASVVTFGMAWVALARLPAGNLLMPTGVLLAPRILFLPSAGAALVAGGALAWCASRVTGWSPRSYGVLRAATASALGVILALGVWRSAVRARDWRDDLTLVSETAVDAPLSYLARYQWGRALFQLGRPAEGEREMRAAIALFPGDPNPYTALADEYAKAGMCAPALPLYRQALAILPTRPDARSGLGDCLMRTDDFAGARAQARIGLAFGYESPRFLALDARADSALHPTGKRAAAAHGAPAVGALDPRPVALRQ